MFKREKKPDKPRQGKRRGGKITIGLVLLAVLAWLGGQLGFGPGGFGFGTGGGSGGTAGTADGGTGGGGEDSPSAGNPDAPGPADNPAAASGAEEADTQEPDDPPSGGAGSADTLIEVREDTILFEGTAVTLEGLKEILLTRNQPETEWRLRDDRAIKAVYDQVKALFIECAAAYAEE